MNVTTALNSLSINCGTTPVGWGVQVNQWSPTDQPTFAVLAKDCVTPAYTGLLGAVDAVPIIGVESRVVAEEGAKLLDMRFIDATGVDVGGFDVRYENGEIIYPWLSQAPDVPVVDLSDILNRLDIIEDTCCDASVDVSGFLTQDSLADYATKSYVTTAIANGTPGGGLTQDTPNTSIFDTYTRETGYTDGGIVLTDRTYYVPGDTGATCFGLTAIKTKAVDGSVFSIMDPQQRTNAIFGTTMTNTVFSPATRVSTGLLLSGDGEATTASALHSYLATSAGNMLPGSEALLSWKEDATKLWAGAFFGNVYIGGNAVLTGTATGWPDYVFDTYIVQPFEERMASQRLEKHLDGLPSMEEIGTEGIPVQRVLIGLVKHIEELYLYLEEIRNAE